MTNLHARAAALLAACDKMTPGPWSADLMYVVGNVPTGRPGGEVIARCGPTVPLTLPNEANSHGIVALRNEAPALIRELLAENERLRTGDTCARQCEGTAYRIEARQLRARVAELEAVSMRIPDCDVGWDAGPDEPLRDAGPAPFAGRTTRRDG